MNYLERKDRNLKFIRFCVGLIVLIAAYLFLLFYKPGLSDVSSTQTRDASALFYTEVENIDDLIKNKPE